MRRFVIALAVCMLITSIGCAAKKVTESISPDETGTVDKAANPIIEECSRLAAFDSDGISGWKLASPISTYDEESIFDYIDGAAELYFAYDFRGVAAAEYQDGQTSIMIDVYDMTSPEGAFGIYSLNRYPEANYMDVGNEGMLDGSVLDFWKGKYFCKVYSFDMAEKYQKDVVNFGRKLALKIEEAGEEPPVVKRLLQDGLVPGTAMFFSRKLGLDNIHFISEENVLNLGEKTKGAVGEYQVNGATFQSFIIEYPSPQEAISAFETYASYLDGKGEPAATGEITGGKSRLVKLDDKFTFIALEDQTLLGFWDVETPETVESMLR